MNYSILQVITFFAALSQLAAAIPFRNLAVRDLAPVMMRREYFNTTTSLEPSSTVAAVSTYVSLSAVTASDGGVYTVYNTVTVTIDASATTSESTFTSDDEQETTTYTSTQYYYVTVNSAGSSSTVETAVAAASSAPLSATSAALTNDIKAANAYKLDPSSSAPASSSYSSFSIIAPSAFSTIAPSTVTVTVTASNCAPAPSSIDDSTTTYVVTKAQTYTIPFSADVSITDSAGSVLTVVPTSTDLTTTYFDYQTITTVLGKSTAAAVSSVSLTSASASAFDFSNSTTPSTSIYSSASINPTTVANSNATNGTAESVLSKRWLLF